MTLLCSTCSHWQGDASSYATPKWALNLMGSEEAAAALFPDAPREEERG